MNNVVEFQKERGSEFFYPALVPEGKYKLMYARHKIVKRFDRDVLELWFTVADFGENFGKPIARFYNVQASHKRRSFTAKPGSDFVQDYAQVFGRRPRFSCAPVDAFKRCYVTARVETVKRNHRQKPLPEAMHYSTVRELLRRELG